MAVETPGSAPALEASLGPIRVRVEKDRVAAFCRETGFEERADGVVPVCFPSVWLSLPEVHGAILRQFTGGDVVPLHESQSFDCRLPLRSGESYDLMVILRREKTPSRLVVDGEVSTLEGSLCVRAQTGLRLVTRGDVAA